jgi:hypothetical protein
MHKIKNFHEGHSTVGEWQGSGRETAWERHGMCEPAFRVFIVRTVHAKTDTNRKRLL